MMMMMMIMTMTIIIIIRNLTWIIYLLRIRILLILSTIVYHF
jgi:hypothetical protein